MKIYFEDGELLESPQLPITDFVVIDAKDGVNRNLYELDELLKANPTATIYTNSILAFNNDYAWNDELGVPEIYIRGGRLYVFTRIDKLTLKELRKAHNLAKMYIAGAFNYMINEMEFMIKNGFL